MSEGETIREGRDADGPALIELIGGVFAEYPGCVLDVDGELPELRSIATSFAGWRGRFWVVTLGGRVVACIGLTPASQPEGIELRKLYVHASARRRGLGGRLVALVEGEAKRRGARFIDMWSDTRFADAHRLYDKLGYRRGPSTRELHDKSDTVEFYFRKEL